MVRMMKYMIRFEKNIPVTTSFAGFSQLGVGGAFTRFDGQLRLFPLLLHFLRSLPEEQVGRNGGSEDSDQRGPISLPTIRRAE